MTGFAIDSQSISLSWHSPPVDTLHGILRYYQIDVIEEQTKTSFSFNSTNNQLTVISLLHPYYKYVISVAASTVGTGPFSENITIETHQDGNNYTSLSTFVRIRTYVCHVMSCHPYGKPPPPPSILEKKTASLIIPHSIMHI